MASIRELLLLEPNCKNVLLGALNIDKYLRDEEKLKLTDTQKIEYLGHLMKLDPQRCSQYKSLLNELCW